MVPTTWECTAGEDKNNSLFTGVSEAGEDFLSFSWPFVPLALWCAAFYSTMLLVFLLF